MEGYFILRRLGECFSGEITIDWSIGQVWWEGDNIPGGVKAQVKRVKYIHSEDARCLYTCALRLLSCEVSFWGSVEFW